MNSYVSSTASIASASVLGSPDVIAPPLVGLGRPRARPVGWASRRLDPPPYPPPHAGEGREGEQCTRCPRCPPLHPTAWARSRATGVEPPALRQAILPTLR